MSTGLLALLDDIAALAKVAAASLDDVAAQTIKAGSKSAAVVVDDAAVTPRYVVGFDASRELPIVGKIALGSLKNKLLILLPAALGLTLFAPWLITPLLMLGGGYLCYEGAEKVLEALYPNAAHQHEQDVGVVSGTPETLENEQVTSAIRTDLILSAEIMAIALASIPTLVFWKKALVLAIVGVGITIVVYGAVALIVRADDIGLALSRNSKNSLFGRISRRSGRALVVGMPSILKLLASVGTAAMLWVGGSILVHGYASLGWSLLEHAIVETSAAVVNWGFLSDQVTAWLVTAISHAVIGVATGGLVLLVVQYVVAPAIRGMRT